MVLATSMVTITMIHNRIIFVSMLMRVVFLFPAFLFVLFRSISTLVVLKYCPFFVGLLEFL